MLNLRVIVLVECLFCLWCRPLLSHSEAHGVKRKRRRLDPLTEGSPKSRRMAQKLIQRFRSQSHDPVSQKTSRRWAIQLKAQPIWVCQRSNKSADECRDSVKQEQDDLIFDLRQLFPSMTLLGQNQHVLNSIFVKLPEESEPPPRHPLIQKFGLEEVYSASRIIEDDVLASVGVTFANERCLSGSGVRVGIIDTGVDYTHEAIGGNGTRESYLNAYGINADAIENTRRDSLFPTPTVIHGKDFLGEDEAIFVEDDDPIDAQGHGTAVASAVLAVAPEVELVVVKACVTASTAACPESALVAGIEFMLDPNQNGILDDEVRNFTACAGSGRTSGSLTWFSASCVAGGYHQPEFGNFLQPTILRLDGLGVRKCSATWYSMYNVVWKLWEHPVHRWSHR